MVDSVIQPISVLVIRDRLKEHQGERIHVRANLGRSKVVEAVGALTQTHPALFVIDAEGKRGRKTRQSYQYVDVLTGTVEITDPVTKENLFPELEDMQPQF